MSKRNCVCIPTAGLGTRLGLITKTINKSLIDINYTPIITHIIKCFPKKTEFVVPLGYKSELVKNYLKLAHPDIKFFFVKVKNYAGKGSGLGLSLLSAKKYLNRPFIFVSCDTLINGKVKFKNKNWVGYSSLKANKNYRKIKINKKNNVELFAEKKSNIKNLKNYIGLAEIYDYKQFWKSMKDFKKISIQQGEFFGLRNLKTIIKAYKFDWIDVGNLDAYLKIKNNFLKSNKKFNILDKPNEKIWFNDNIVIKFFKDESISKKRVLRYKTLKNFIPKLLDYKKNIYSYSKENGTIFSKISNKNIFLRLLNHIEKFHKYKKLPKFNKNYVKNKCNNFYKTKTIKRINLFYKRYKVKDNLLPINGSKKVKLSLLLNKLNWNFLSEGKFGRYHGDLHFENIIYSKNKKFIFLDWRHEFDKNVHYGDIYYDLAKLMHGIIVSHDSIIKKKYKINWNSNKINYEIKNKKIYKSYLKIYTNWLIKKNYSIEKINILTALIFLNIAPLHHYPYSLFLYALGKKKLIDIVYK